MSASRAWTNGTDIEALSINASWYGVNRVAEKMIQLENEKPAELVAQDPQRFVAFASVALECPDRAADQLAKASTSAICGTLLAGHVTGDELSNPKFDPCWKKGGGAGLPGFCAHAEHSGNEPAAGRQLRG